MDQPPVIDAQGLLAGAAGARERLAAMLPDPCRSWGMFHLTGHGIPEADLAAFGAAMEGFFARPEPEKRRVRRTRENARGYYDEELTKNRPDWKEIFDYGAEPAPGRSAARHSDGVNQWPADEGFRTLMLRHHASMHTVAMELLRALCVSLGLPHTSLDACFEGDSSFLRLNHYPVCTTPAGPDSPPLPEKGHLGVHPHSDAGALTLLYQDDVAGLQIQQGDRFELVEPVTGALTVNLGDMLRVWSNDRYRSPVHRVLARADRDRFSAPFFLNPRYDTVCEPLLAPEARTVARFRPVSWAHFRDQRSAGDFADEGDEIQVDDFLLAGALPGPT